LIIINKATGMTVHPGAGQREHTLVNALRATLLPCCRASAERNGPGNRSPVSLKDTKRLPRPQQKTTWRTGNYQQQFTRAHGGKGLPTP